jgi:hypothetical protein
MIWEDFSKKIDKEVTVGIKVPKTDEGYRPVTKIRNSRIYMRTGVITEVEKYTNKEIIQYAYEKILSGEYFTSKDLKAKFPKEFRQGSCVFSMTGGILMLLGVAELKKNKNQCYYKTLKSL